MEKNQEKKDSIYAKVREGYGAIAEGTSQSCCGPTSCCGGSQTDAATQLAQSIGYETNELKELPEGANMGLSCGNPVALASLRKGEVVLDLGSGGGFDVFIAGRKVGPTGGVIGVDMTPEMISKARRNTPAYREGSGLDNVEFRLGEIEHLPVADNTVDVVISNCVINLSPDKPQVWREIARALKPGGRVAVSDIVLKKALPETISQNAAALVGCIAGAMLLEELRRTIADAGLTDAVFEEKAGYVDAMVQANAEIAAQMKSLLKDGESIADYIASMNIQARKS